MTITVSTKIQNMFKTKVHMLDNMTNLKATGTITYLADGSFNFRANTLENSDWNWNSTYLETGVDDLLDILERDITLTPAQLAQAAVSRKTNTRDNMNFSR